MIPDTEDNLGESYPSPAGDLEFDLSPVYATAWEAAAPTRKSRRKQFGMTKSQKKQARREASRRRLRRSTSEPITNGTPPPPKAWPQSANTSPSSLFGNGPTPDNSGPQKRFSKRNLRKTSSFSSYTPPSDQDAENYNPNIITQDEAICSPPLDSKSRSLLSPMQEHPKSRPRKIRALSDYDDLQKSFAELARESHAATGWNDTTPTYNDTSLAFDFDDYDHPSPNGSIATRGSSRKRGPFGSTNGDMISISSSGFLNDISNNSGGGLKRTKSRSRIYSQSSNSCTRDTTKSLRRESTLDSDDSEAPASDDDMNCSDVDKSMESAEKTCHNDKAGVPMPPLTRRTSTSKLEAGVFGAAPDIKKHELCSKELCHSMSSIEDLKFLIYNLRKEEKRVSTSFGNAAMWTVSLPSKWSSERRAQLLSWSTKTLGFSMRTGGPSMFFLNISASQAPTILSQLEATFSFNRSKKPEQTESRDNSLPTSIFVNLKHPNRSSPFSSSKPLVTHDSSDPQSLDGNLIEAVTNLNITAATPESSNVCPPSSLQASTLEPTLGVDEITAEDKSVYQSRPSGEHAIGGRDMVNHIHVVSPRKSRRPRLSGDRPIRTPKLSFDTAGMPSRASSPYAGPSMQVCLETPHMTRRSYKENQNNVRDWGTSAACPKAITIELLNRLEAEEISVEKTEALDESFATEGGNDSDTVLDSDVDDVLGDFDDTLFPMNSSPDNRRSSMGTTAFASLNLLDDTQKVVDNDRLARRRIGSLAKHRRVSLFANTMQSRNTIRPSRKSHFAGGARMSIAETTLALHDAKRFSFLPPPVAETSSFEEVKEPEIVQNPLMESNILSGVFSFLDEQELLCGVSPVCSEWADVCTEAHATLMLSSVGCLDNLDDIDDLDAPEVENEAIMRSMEKDWKYLVNQYPWACFLSEGAFKKVYKVWNSSTKSEEAISVMDIDLIESTGNKNVVGAELAVSAMLSSLVRRNVCPNFVLTRRVFTCPYEPPASHWGSEENKKPKGAKYIANRNNERKPREPKKKDQGRYQYMRMELCSDGDAEEYLKRQKNESISCIQAQQILFQVAFALHVAADRFCMKHYDMKLLNVFLQRPENDCEYTTMRYGLGSHVFSLKMKTEDTVIAKLADYGTANIEPESNGKPATIGQFTTLENTPPEFMILGDAAKQGHGHDAFGLGLCMLHLFTGHAPYEEILEDVVCPPGLKQKLQRVWEDETVKGYSVIRSVIWADVCTNEDGDVIEGEPDEVLYDTLYRYLVLFGIPEIKKNTKEQGKVWAAITSTLDGSTKRGGRANRTFGKRGKNNNGISDAAKFEGDRQKYSIHIGSDKYIARARRALEKVEGGMELLLSLVCFDPERRATACDVLNSQFMISFQQGAHYADDEDTSVMSFLAYATR